MFVRRVYHGPCARQPGRRFKLRSGKPGSEVGAAWFQAMLTNQVGGRAGLFCARTFGRITRGPGAASWLRRGLAVLFRRRARQWKVPPSCLVVSLSCPRAAATAC